MVVVGMIQFRNVKVGLLLSSALCFQGLFKKSISTMRAKTAPFRMNDGRKDNGAKQSSGGRPWFGAWLRLARAQSMLNKRCSKK